jgi:putative drug exporter of the RND superfamily
VAGLARWCFRRRRIVLAAWLLALILIGGIARSAGSTYATNFSFPATDSSRALAVLKANFPAQAGDLDQIVVQAKAGTLDNPATRQAVTAMLKQVAALPDVRQVRTPYGCVLATPDFSCDGHQQPGVISADRTIGLATVNLSAQVQDVPKSSVTRIIDTAQSADSSTLNVQLGGLAISNSERTKQSFSEGLGVLLSLVVLFFAFRRSILCALLPLISALMAIGVGTSVIGLLTHVFSIPEFGPILATLVSLGVGVDYALFIVSRHRNGLLAGATPEEAAVTALNTSGRAVLFAGLTVCIALLGMFALQVSFLYGVALSAAFVVALTMVASLTLLPAMLGFFGLKALRRGERRRLAEFPQGEPLQGFWLRWSQGIQGRARYTSLVALGLIVVIAIPFFSLRQGLSDAGNDPVASTTRQAYDLLAKGFGPGYSGPLEVVAEVNSPSDSNHFTAFATSLAREPDVASVQPIRISPNGKAAVAVVYPGTAPQAVQTSALLHRVRAAIPAAQAGTTLAIHVGGPTAEGEDFSHALSAKMPQFVAVVVLLAFLLLLAVFRSLLIPLVASIMNLLSIGAALGALTAAFQWGWGKSIIGYTKTGPIEVFIPVMLFAILFGLSMDYEVFLVSRMHEEWVNTGDNDQAVTLGQAETGRVITAAALIMILVFVSFIFGGQLVIKEFGLGFAAAIFIDAFVIRTILVPSVMHLIGKANWWLPGWLDRAIPKLHVEAAGVPPALAESESLAPTR